MIKLKNILNEQYRSGTFDAGNLRALGLEVLDYKLVRKLKRDGWQVIPRDTRSNYQSTIQGIPGVPKSDTPLMTRVQRKVDYVAFTGQGMDFETAKAAAKQDRENKERDAKVKFKHPYTVEIYKIEKENIIVKILQQV